MIVSRAGILRVLSRWFMNSLLFLIFCGLFFRFCSFPLISPPPRKWQSMSHQQMFLSTLVVPDTVQAAADTEVNTVSSLGSTFLSQNHLFPPGRNLSELRCCSLGSAKGIFQNWIVNRLKARLCPCLLMPWLSGMREKKQSNWRHCFQMSSTEHWNSNDLSLRYSFK